MLGGLMALVTIGVQNIMTNINIAYDRSSSSNAINNVIQINWDADVVTINNIVIKYNIADNIDAYVDNINYIELTVNDIPIIKITNKYIDKSRCVLIDNTLTFEIPFKYLFTLIQVIMQHYNIIKLNVLYYDNNIVDSTYCTYTNLYYDTYERRNLVKTIDYGFYLHEFNNTDHIAVCQKYYIGFFHVPYYIVKGIDLDDINDIIFDLDGVMYKKLHDGIRYDKYDDGIIVHVDMSSINIKSNFTEMLLSIMLNKKCNASAYFNHVQKC